MGFFEDHTPRIRVKRKGEAGKRARLLRPRFTNTDAAKAYARKLASTGKYELVVVQLEKPSSDDTYLMLMIHGDGREEE